ncbi:hypothetical protein ACWZQY_023965 [Priestia megaterium]
MAEDQRILLNENTGQFIDELKEHYRIEDTKTIYRLLFAKGITNLPLDYAHEVKPGKKKDIRLEVFESDWMNAGIRQKFKLNELLPETKKKIYRNAMEHGAQLLKEEIGLGSRSYFLSLFLARSEKLKSYDREELMSNFTTSPAKTVKPIVLRLGEDELGKPIEILLNDSRHTPHISIAGKSRSGKTQGCMEMMAQVKECDESVKVLFTDFVKGDVAGDDDFVRSLNAEVINVTKEGLPYNPFYLSKVNDSTIEQLKEVFTSVQKTIGPNQSLDLFEMLQEVYREFPEPYLADVYHHIVKTYEERGRRKDSLVELFHKMYVNNYFPGEGKQERYRTLSDKDIIFNLSKIPATSSVKEIIAFLVLNKIYTENVNLPDSKIDSTTNLREIRTIVVIDEAHCYLGAKNPILEKMLRELASKGVAVILLTQGYGDLVKGDFDYNSQMNWTFILRSENTKQAIEKALYVSSNISGNLANVIAGSETGVTYCRKLREEDESFTKWKAKLFFERHEKRR